MAVIAGLTAASAAQAQDIQGFKPAVGTWNYLSVDGGRITAPGSFRPTLYVNYARNPLVHHKANGSIDERVVENLTTFDLVLAVGLHERVELGLDVPFGYGTGSPAFNIDTGAGLGDIRLLPKLVILGVNEPTGFGLGVVAPLSFPTGDESKGNSSRRFVATPKVVAEYRASTWSAALNAGYRWRPSDGDDEPLTVGSGIVYGAAGAVNLGTASVQGIVEFFGTRYQDVSVSEGGPTPLEALVGLRLFNDVGLSFTLGGGAGLIDDFGAPQFRVLSALAWTPAEREAPMTLVQADGDRDGDGVRDSSDVCPDVPEDRDGFEDVDGCPDLDNDHDGIVDADDKCPASAEDVDGFEDQDGCPDLDVDGDGIADAIDQCPRLAEVHNGVDDADGCPDDTLVAVAEGRINLGEMIHFSRQKWFIKKNSYFLLDQVATLMIRNPTIRRVRIEGHTDRTGSERYNNWLSGRRARAVRAYLIDHGVSSERLVALGMGEAQPLVDTDGPEARAMNRRVEFHILEGAAAEAPLPPEPSEESDTPPTEDDEPPLRSETFDAAPAAQEAEAAYDPVPTNTAPTDPTPLQAAEFEAIPTDPAPTDPTPMQAAEFEAVPTDAAPTEAADFEAVPTDAPAELPVEAFPSDAPAELPLEAPVDAVEPPAAAPVVDPFGEDPFETPAAPDDAANEAPSGDEANAAAMAAEVSP